MVTRSKKVPPVAKVADLLWLTDEEKMGLTKRELVTVDKVHQRRFLDGRNYRGRDRPHVRGRHHARHDTRLAANRTGLEVRQGKLPECSDGTY